MEPNKPHLFEDVSLPKNFRFPEAYISEISRSDSDQVGEWWLIALEPKKAQYFFSSINDELQSKKTLVPFAKNDDDGSGNIACFDGDDTSGNPKIYFVSSDGPQLLRDVDWSTRFSLADFDAWLIFARQEYRL